MGAQAQAAQTKVNIKKETVEDIVLRHSKRGMTILRKYMASFTARGRLRRFWSFRKEIYF